MAEPTQWHLGDVIRKRREARGWTQTELARRAGVHVATVFRVEHGGNCFHTVLRRLAAALGTTVGELEREVPRTAQPVPAGQTDELLAAAVRRWFARLSPDEQQTVARFVWQTAGLSQSRPPSVPQSDRPRGAAPRPAGANTRARPRHR